MPLPFNGYPATYQQYYPQFQPMYQQPNSQIQQIPAQQEQKAINGFDWVIGDDGANAYMVPAGKTFILFDASPNSEHFFLKSSDPMGKPSPAIKFDYCEHKEEKKNPEEKAQVVDLSTCAKKEDFDVLRKEFEELKKKPEPDHLTAEDVREIFNELIDDRFAKLTAPASETKSRKKET